MNQEQRLPRERRTAKHGGWLWCLAGAAQIVLAGAAAGQEPPRSALAGVAALEKPVTYTETKIPLGELVQKVSADTGVRLTATPDVADEPVAAAAQAAGVSPPPPPNRFRSTTVISPAGSAPSCALAAADGNGSGMTGSAAARPVPEPVAGEAAFSWRAAAPAISERRASGRP